jgi:hypothetical protein
LRQNCGAAVHACIVSVFSAYISEMNGSPTSAICAMSAPPK